MPCTGTAWSGKHPVAVTAAAITHAKRGPAEQKAGSESTTGTHKAYTQTRQTSGQGPRLLLAARLVAYNTNRSVNPEKSM